MLEPWNPNTLFRGVQTYIIILMSGDFKATPFARLFFGIFWKGLVRKSTIWALLIFLHSRTFQARFGVWSLLLPAQRVLRASKGLRKGSTRKGIEKQIQLTTKMLEPWNPNTSFRGVQTYIFILMSGDFKATPFARLFFGIFWKGLVRKSTI